MRSTSSMSSANDVCSCDDEKHSTSSSNLTGIRLFKSMVRLVRQKITESKVGRSSSADDVPAIVGKFESMSTNDASSGHPKNGVRPRSPPGKEAIRRLFGSLKAASDERPPASGYNSDSDTMKQRDSRLRVRQKPRGRSKSDSRRVEKKTKKILRPPPTYVYVRGLSGIPTQRVRVR